MCQISPFGVILKRYQPGKWKLIVDLSSPKNASVNDSVDTRLCSLDYPTVHDATKTIRALGKGTLLAKLDLKNAYRVVPVNPQDRHLLAVKWEDEVLIDGALPFGLRSAPKLFTAIADTLMWIMEQRGVTHTLHYLDDFLFLGNPASTECAHSLAIALEVCFELGVPVAPQKVEGPSTYSLCVGPAEPPTTKAGQIAVRDSKLARTEKMHEKRAPVAIRPAKPRRFSYRSGQDLHEGLDRPPQARHRPSPLHSPQLIRQSGHHLVGHFHGVVEWN